MKHLIHLMSMAHSPLCNYIVPGLASHLIGGNGEGTVRMFEATRTQDEFITPHNHRYAFSCLVLRGSVTNTVFKPNNGLNAEPYLITTMEKCDGGFKRGAASGKLFTRETFKYSEGDWYSMAAHEFHSINFEKNSLVLFFEGKNTEQTSEILEPIVNGQNLRTFEVKDWMYQK